MARQLFQRFVSFFRTPTGPVLDAYFGSGAGGTKRTARYEVNEKDGGSKSLCGYGDDFAWLILRLLSIVDNEIYYNVSIWIIDLNFVMKNSW